MRFNLLVENNFVVEAVDLSSYKFVAVVAVDNAVAVAISFVHSIHSFVVFLLDIVEVVE